MALGWSVGARLFRWVISAAITVAVFYALAGRWDLPWLWATAALGSLLTLVLTLTIDLTSRGSGGGRGRAASIASPA